MDERIKEYLKYLNKYYLLVREAKKLPYQAFAEDPVQSASSERFLHLAIESCLNIGNRLISLYQLKKPVDTPETYADIFRAMRKLGIIDDGFAQRLVKMAKFRNVLVHLYWEIDQKSVYRFLQKNLDDFKLFQEKVVDFLNRNPLFLSGIDSPPAPPVKGEEWPIQPIHQSTNHPTLKSFRLTTEKAMHI
jgi:uncharacterized protein YutE (UPF0331/DUF86 family)